MATFSSLGIGLSFLFGCVVFAFVGEVYYLLCTNSSKIPKAQETSLHESDENQEKQQEITQKDSPLKGLGEESVDLELMRLHNLCGPPRFLFTINEETKEDLEKESRKSRSYSLSELLCTPETPMCSSPLIKDGQKLSNLEGFLNPLYDIDSEFDFNKIRSSPPPTFKFLRDAEEKLLKRLMELEAVKKASLMQTDEKINGSNLVKLDGNKGKSEVVNIHHDHHQMSTTPSQVLPLASSPSK
uniref:uncharacterized protein LOC122609241 n=1 Tax=Erigeron canadensis TaxID=72917 RepID=UPI001CB9C5DA|nr:uncharacterized protein LOC122609241 [Erigeron canadensis]